MGVGFVDELYNVKSTTISNIRNKIILLDKLYRTNFVCMIIS